MWRNGSASDFDCHSLSEGCSFEYCHAHFFPVVIATRFRLRLARLPPHTLSILHVWPTATTTAGWWCVRFHDAGVDVYRHGAIWLDDSTTIWWWSLWCHSKPIDFDWHGSIWVYSATAIHKYFWIYHNWDSRDGNRRWLIWIHESSTAATATTTAAAAATTATTGLNLW